MIAKHIIFISSKDEYAKNDEFVKTKLLKKFNPQIYSHLLEDEAHGLDANIAIIFGTEVLYHKFPDKDFGKFFRDEDQQMYTSVKNWKEYDRLEKKEITIKIKELREKLNKYFSRFALVRVTDKSFFYRDIDFKKIKGRNSYKADHKYIEDATGDFMSYDGKKLKKVPKEYQTFDQTYEEHLRAKDIFYIENYPNVAHTKLLHYCTFDIETNLSLDTINTPEPIVSIVAYSNIYDKYLVWILKKRPEQTYDAKQFPKEKIFEFEDEIAMLTHFFKTMEKLEVDLLGGWNSDFYDMPYLLHRSKKLGAEFSNYLSEVYETIGKDGEKSYYCHEIILWDYQRYAKWIIIENKPIAWSLDAVSQHLFNEKKIEHEGVDKLWEDNDLTKLIQYNIKDVYLTEKIAQKQKIIEFPILYQKIAPQTYENVYFNSRFLETLIHLRFKQFKFPSKKKKKMDSTFEGALVLDTQPGLFENVSVYDFSSLYPSIMISLNLSKDTIVEDFKDFDPKSDVKVGTTLFTTKKKGVIPQLSQLLLGERNKLKKRKMQFDGESQEFKILNDLENCFKGTSNALYGVLGYRGFILYDQRVAAAVTYVARETLRFTKSKAEEQGYSILTGDTDSIFIKIQAKDFTETVEKSKALQDLFNKSLPEFLHKFTQNEKFIHSHIMQIAFEKSFSKLLLSSAKKKQVGYLKFFKGKFLPDGQEPYIKGFEAIKDDTPTYFKKILIELYKNILDNYGDVDKLKNFISRVRLDLKQQKPIDLIVRKKMSKKIEEYDTSVQHVRAIRNSNVTINRGATVNILFVKDQREVIHYEPELNLKFEIDYNKYFNDFLKKKIQLIDEDLYYKLFLTKVQLVDKSKLNIENRIKRKRAVTQKLGE
jgi:DNA polymerase elongation subunit (family B)